MHLVEHILNISILVDSKFLFLDGINAPIDVKIEKILANTLTIMPYMWRIIYF